MMRGLGGFQVGQEFFVQFLTWAQSGEFYSNVFFRHQSRKPDHKVREVNNSNGISHVEHENLTSLSHKSGFQHQLTSLGDGHEITGDFRMGDRNGATCLYLSGEQGNYRAI